MCRGLIVVVGLVCAAIETTVWSQAQELTGIQPTAAVFVTSQLRDAPEEARYPGEILSLNNWKLTIPWDTIRPGKPDEVTHPELLTFVDPSCFFLSADREAVHLRAHCGGVTTKGSSYPRSELRQMVVGGEKEAKWSTDDEAVQEMVAEVAIIALPDKKPHVVCAQIHDADDDLLMIRLEKKKLFIERPGQPDVMLASNYELGERFQLRIAAGGGRVRVWYDDVLNLDWPVSRDGCYFKVGCYTQSNTSRGDVPRAFAEVALYNLTLSK